MAPTTINQPRKFQHIYTDDDGCVSIWKYDLDRTTSGPVSVEIKYPPGWDKDWKDAQKQAALEKKGKLGELHDAFAKLDAKRKREKAKQTPNKK
jgi:hypothetical protein